MSDKVVLPYTDSCFVCGRENPSGLHAETVYEDGRAVIRITPTQQHCGYHAMVHGGLLTTMLDEVMGWAPAYETRRMCVAGEINVRFITPVPIGTPLVISGWFAEDKKRLWICRGTITGEDGTVFVRATGKYVPIAQELAASIEEEQLIYPEGMAKLFT